MFDNSFRVPRLYKLASKVAKEVSDGRGSIKQLVYECKHPNIKALYALVVQTFQKTDDIENLFKKSKLLVKEPRLDPWLAKILVTELLWGKKRLPDKSKPIQTVLAYEQIFKAHLSDVSDDFEEIIQVDKPRYVRVNTLKISINEVVEGFRNEGWILKHHSKTDDYVGFLEAITNLGPEEFMIDMHIPYLLIFPPKTQFYKHQAYKNGSIILQDKASCLPVHILNPEPESTVLDMCAAPGMKTTQCASLMNDTGKIYAVEIGKKRYKTLKKIVDSSGATCIETINADVLTLSGKDYPNVEYILVDPSCSGSGITDRVEIGQQKQDQNKNRLEKLAGFQRRILKYALTRFPKVRRVVYSTCSVYPEENEDVVRQVLEICMNFKLVPAVHYVKNNWTNFGSAEFGDIGNFCLYSRPDIDLTSGFFVAVFERLDKGEKNPFLNEMLFAQIIQGQKMKKLEEDGSEGRAQKRKNKNMNPENGEKSKASVDETEHEDITKIKKRRQEETLDDVSVTNAKSEEATESIHKKKKKKKKSALNESSASTDTNILDDVDNAFQKQLSSTEETNELSEYVLHKKIKKKKSHADCPQEEISDLGKSNNVVEDTFQKKKKKKKKKHTGDVPVDTFVNTETAQNDGNHKKKKKKNEGKNKEGKSENEYSFETLEDGILKNQRKKNKKRKENEQEVDTTQSENKHSKKYDDKTDIVVNCDNEKQKKKKKKTRTSED